jgi:hypothetical protein
MKLYGLKKDYHGDMEYMEIHRVLYETLWFKKGLPRRHGAHGDT